MEGAIAHFAEIGRRGKVIGPIKADQIDIGRDAHAENLHGKKVLLRSGAHAKNVYGEEITIESRCRISGDVQYTSNLRVNRDASLAKPPQKVNKLPF